jgi:ribosomal protein S12 methylthiotransferase accessory factor
MQTTDEIRNAAQALVDTRCGVIKKVSVTESPPGEPMIYSSAIDRETPAEITDGRDFTPMEGGCSIEREQAAAAAVGEAVERYCASIYRAEQLACGAYSEIDDAIDPERVVTFDPDQQPGLAERRELYTDGDQLRWVKGSRQPDGERVAVPAQLVYLNYDEPAESVIRSPISTGLAAGMDRAGAVRRGMLEVIERDAFMLYYLTKAELPQIEIDGATSEIRTITGRLDRAGLDWVVLDARTDLDVPVVIAVLIDDGPGPTVSVAASAHTTAETAVKRALEEAIQTRLYQRYLLATSEEPIDLSTLQRAEIGRKERVLGWCHESVRGKLSFWRDSDRSIQLATISEQSDCRSHAELQQKANSELTFYISELTTRDISEVGFTVVRALAPSAQPLYLLEENRYWERTRLESVLENCEYDLRCPPADQLNEYPHPFP